EVDTWAPRRPVRPKSSLLSAPAQDATHHEDNDDDHDREAEPQPNPDRDVEVEVTDPSPREKIRDPVDDEGEDLVQQRWTGAEAGIAWLGEDPLQLFPCAGRVGRIDPRLQRRVQGLQPLLGIDQVRRSLAKVTQNLGLASAGALHEDIDRLLDRGYVTTLGDLHQGQGPIHSVGV